MKKPVLVALAMFSAGIASASPIDLSAYLQNFGFEQTDGTMHTCTGTGGYTVNCTATVKDWQAGAVGGPLANGTFQPNTNTATNAAYPAASGLNAAFVTNFEAYQPVVPVGVSGDPGVWGVDSSWISQTVTAALVNGTDYTLSLAVISKRLPDPDSPDYAAHFRIMVYTDTNWGWSLTGDTLGLAPKTWYHETLAFHTPSSGNLGSNFTVYLVNDGASDPTLAPGKYSQVEFDAVPEPSTFVLLGAGLLALAATVRRRNVRLAAIAR